MQDLNNPSTTRQNLINAGVKLFAIHGYEATSTRMIAKEANVNIATIAFHFQNKEGFYRAVLKYVAHELDRPLLPLVDHVRRLRSANSITPAVAWVLIEEYVDSMLKTVLVIQDFEHAHYLNLLYHEQLYHPGNEYPITQVVCKKMESILTELLQDYRKDTDRETATTISRIVSSSIVAFGEHPMFIRRALGLADDAPLPDHIIETAKEYLLNGIRSFRAQA
ncbi:Bacterial regulatory proteins, tetR family [Caprobacter fermentans]|uniref:Bacterial regulatory proteins, tetR family n=1 Tax=Caproicibacter fermentans TaxID=2576756 RepID=A0A6N8I3X8_9FIRM|nr:TetR family transcriptional regulator [Caproicibacter fermentans]MVB12300.1 Bacterial regulatory proteins, tetR family [Caproicibacter fermentans]OCN02654.1 hypothetical protein A7X67_18925 [Clostridium sp. W14A]QNK39772.1 TetR family transcriptional regulator [Caproicibacter fermentans]